MNDDDLRQLLPTLDRIERVPPDKVEQLWAELEAVLDDRSPSEVATLAPRASRPRRYSRWMEASIAATIVAMVVGVALLSRQGSSPDSDVEPAVADVPTVVPEPTVVPSSDVVPDPAPSTIDEACGAFRRSVADPWPFDSFGVTPDDVDALTAWVDGLGTLLSDVDRIGRPADSTDQYLSIQLLRTALRTAIDDIEVGDDADAATALANARRHLDAIQLGESALAGCVPADGAGGV